MEICKFFIANDRVSLYKIGKIIKVGMRPIEEVYSFKLATKLPSPTRSYTSNDH